MTKDICYGPIAAGQFFVCRLNNTPSIYEAMAFLAGREGEVMICRKWGMNESRWIWSFGPYPNEDGWQVAVSNLQEMERVSKLTARHISEQELRRRDDEWRAQYDTNRAPIKIVRCTCGAGDDAGRNRHTIGCFLCGE